MYRYNININTRCCAPFFPGNNLHTCRGSPSHTVSISHLCPTRCEFGARTEPTVCRKISEEHDKVFVTGCLDPETQANAPRANAALVVLARNSELQGVVQSIKSMERHFNRWFNYPYVFLNDGDFNSTFKETILNHTSSPVEFGKIDPEMWGYPDWANVEVAREGIRKQGDKAIMYGGMESYHHMCRFYSGFVHWFHR